MKQPKQSWGKSPHVMSDIKDFRTQDGTRITSRSALREYEKSHGVKQIGNDYASLHKELRQKVYGRD